MGREERTDAGLVEQLRCELLGQGFDLAGELALLVDQLLDAARDGAQREQAPRSSGSCRLAGRVAASRASSLARVSGRSSARNGSGVVISRSRSWQRPARFAFTAPSRAAISARSASRSPPARGVACRSCASTAAGGPDRVERVGLAARTPLPRQPADLEHPLAAAGQEARQAGPVRACPLDRERTPPRRVLSPTRALPVAIAVCRHGRLEHDHAVSHLDDAERMLDPGAGRHQRRSPTDLQPSRSTSSPALGDTLRCRSGDENRGRQDCDGSRPTRADRLLIRPASGRQTGTGLSARTHHWKDTATAGHSEIESRTKSTAPPWQQPQTGHPHTHSSGMSPEREAG